jgi:hypothetical protein
MARIQRILAIRGPCVTHPRQTLRQGLHFADPALRRQMLPVETKHQATSRRPRELQSANGQADGAIRLVAPLHAVDRRQPLHPFD